MILGLICQEWQEFIVPLMDTCLHIAKGLFSLKLLDKSIVLTKQIENMAHCSPASVFTQLSAYRIAYSCYLFHKQAHCSHHKYRAMVQITALSELETTEENITQCVKAPCFSSAIKVLQKLAMTSHAAFVILTKGRAQLNNSPTSFGFNFSQLYTCAFKIFLKLEDEKAT